MIQPWESSTADRKEVRSSRTRLIRSRLEVARVQRAVMSAISAVEMAYIISLTMNNILHVPVAHLALPSGQSALLTHLAHLPPGPLPLLPRQCVQALSYSDLHADIPSHLGRPSFLLLILPHVRSRQVGCCSSGCFCTDPGSRSSRSGVGAVENTFELGDVAGQSAGVVECEGCLMISSDRGDK